MCRIDVAGLVASDGWGTFKGQCLVHPSTGEVLTMLTITGARSPGGNGMTRRGWLRIGGLALGGLALPDILRAEARSGTRSSAKGIIMVLLPGGPTHLD